MKLGVVGSRTFEDYAYMWGALVALHFRYGLTGIVSGGARGADRMAEKFCREELGMEPTVILPDWDKYGKKAGFLRNIDIVQVSDYIVAFWDGKSRGTEHSIGLARNQAKLLRIYKDWT
jgi:hypothetical protein